SSRGHREGWHAPGGSRERPTPGLAGRGRDPPVPAVGPTTALPRVDESYAAGAPKPHPPTQPTRRPRFWAAGVVLADSATPMVNAVLRDRTDRSSRTEPQHATCAGAYDGTDIAA